MNNFNDENEIKEDSEDFTEENYNSDDNMGLEDGKTAGEQDITGEVAMENIRWGDSQRNKKKKEIGRAHV